MAEFAIGVRYTKPELERAVEEADQRGFKRGDKAGYDRGYSEGEDFGYDSGYSAGSNAGYSRGENAGCNSVFDLIGETLIAIRYPWYKLNVYGYRYDRADVC